MAQPRLGGVFTEIGEAKRSPLLPHRTGGLRHMVAGACYAKFLADQASSLTPSHAWFKLPI
jgi:hypothetical protein